MCSMINYNDTGRYTSWNIIGIVNYNIGLRRVIMRCSFTKRVQKGVIKWPFCVSFRRVLYEWVSQECKFLSHDKNRTENDLVFMNVFHKCVNFYHMLRNRRENDLCQFEINFPRNSAKTSHFCLAWFMVWLILQILQGYNSISF